MTVFGRAKPSQFDRIEAMLLAICQRLGIEGGNLKPAEEQVPIWQAGRPYEDPVPRAATMSMGEFEKKVLARSPKRVVKHRTETKEPPPGRYGGTVKSFMASKPGGAEWGWIVCAGLGRDVFVHQDFLATGKRLEIGDRVAFSVGKGPNGLWRAEDVRYEG